MTALDEEVASGKPGGLAPDFDAISALHYVQLSSTQLVSKAASGFGIAPADMRVLYMLKVETDATPKRVATHTGLTTGAVTSLIDRLMDAGLATRAPHPSDRRSITLALTERGEAAVAEVTRLYNAAFLESIDPADMRALAASLGALSAAFGNASRAEEGEEAV